MIAAIDRAIDEILSRLGFKPRPDNPQPQAGTPESPAPAESAEEEERYTVLVEIEHIGVLADASVIAKALIEKRPKMNGSISIGIAFAQNSTGTCSLSPLIRIFHISDEADFEPFAEAMMTIPGVTGVKKQGEKWTRTEKELKAYREECQQVEAEKKRQSDESWKERERKLAELKALQEYEKALDDADYGPWTDSSNKLLRPEFEKFLESLGHCYVEGLATFSDILAGGFLDYVRDIKEFADGSEFVTFAEAMINGPMRIPFMSEAAFWDIPWAVEYREKNGQRIAHLMVGGGKPTYIMTSIEFFIREQGPKRHWTLVVPRRECPCGAGMSQSDNCDYDCPICGRKFCSVCAVKDYEGPGDYVLCPGCKTKLYLP